MKKKLLGIMAVAAVAIIAGYNVYISQAGNTLSELALSNVEALANSNESDGCPNGCVSGWGGCYCNGWYPNSQEYSGWN